MSISRDNICMHDIAQQKLGVDWKNINMAELGNQKILNVDKNGKEYKVCTSKKYFTKKGATHTSFDINGKDGSVPINLCESIDNKWKNKFDIVTNYGTSEHVENQWMVFKNINDMCKIDGMMIHSIPMFGSWRGHCPFHYKSDFPEDICDICGYKLIYKNIQLRHKNRLLNFILQKKFDCFVEREIFGNGIVFSKNYHKNTDNLF